MNDMLQLVNSLHHRPGASDSAIAESEKLLMAKLPSEYIDFLKITNGGEGFVGQNAYVILWSVDELASMNKSYAVDMNAPGLLLFGSDGGAEAYGFDTRIQRWPIVQVPFVGMSWELAVPAGDTFHEFLNMLYRIE